MNAAELPNPLRVLFFGMAGATSATVLAALLDASVEICGVVLAAGRFARATQPEPIVPLAPPPIRLLGSSAPTIADLAHARGIPAFELRRATAPTALDALTSLRPDVACVACFPLRIPAALLKLPPHGFLNVHPSLLPRHRGPEPLFWTLRAGEQASGVTIHAMDEQLDTGEIVAQQAFELSDGISGPAAEHTSARLGGQLLVAALGALAGGTLVRRPQPPGGSYERFPAADDWRISSDWAARRAFNFMRGTSEWGVPYRLIAGGLELEIAEALDYRADNVLPAPVVWSGDELQIQFTPGVLRARR